MDFSIHESWSTGSSNSKDKSCDLAETMHKNQFQNDCWSKGERCFRRKHRSTSSPGVSKHFLALTEWNRTWLKPQGQRIKKKYLLCQQSTNQARLVRCQRSRNKEGKRCMGLAEVPETERKLYFISSKEWKLNKVKRMSEFGVLKQKKKYLTWAPIV